MKKDTHPQYQDITFTCACGATYTAGSIIQKDFKTEICSNCHPFYTGKQKLVDTSGRVDKFMAKMQKAEQSRGEQPQSEQATKSPLYQTKAKGPSSKKEEEPKK